MGLSNYVMNGPNIRKSSPFDPGAISVPDMSNAYSPSNLPLANTPDFRKTVTPWLEGAYAEAAHTKNTSHPFDPSPSVYSPSLISNRQPDIVHDVYQPRMAQLAEQIDQQLQPHPMGKLRTIAAGLLSGRAPALANVISGDYQRSRILQPLEQQYTLLSNIIAANRAQQTTDITNRLHGAQADYFEQRPDLMNQPKQTPQEQALQDYMGRVNPATKKNYTPAEALKQINQDAQEVKPTHPSEEDKAISDYMAANKLEDNPANRNKARVAVANQKRPPQDEELKGINKQLKQAQLEKAMEATPDEQRRADLAKNLEENLSNLEDIARRRPELFGPVSGRMTGAKQWIGSSDPDVAALKVIEEQTGLAMVGAHAMRNAQHAEKAAQSITGANHTPASALLAPNGPIAKARESLATFKADAQRRRKAITGEGEPEPSSGNEIHYKIVNGELVPQ